MWQKGWGRVPGYPSTHPAEGRGQGQQSSCDAVLVQGGAILRQSREPVGASWAPHAPPGVAAGEEPPTITHELSAPAPARGSHTMP